MRPKKYDWKAIKQDFMAGEYSLKELAQKYNMSYGYMRSNAAGWESEKSAIKKEFSDIVITEMVARDTIDSTIDRNVRHIAIWDKFVNIVEETLDNADFHLKGNNDKLNIAALERLSNIMQKAQAGQRIALGLDKDAGNAKGLLSELTAAIRAEDDDNQTE